MPTETIGVMFPIVFAGTPAFDKSLTDEKGRAAMIFFAVAGPTPGSDSSWDWEAALRSIFAPPADACFAEEWPLLAVEADEVSVVKLELRRFLLFLP